MGQIVPMREDALAVVGQGCDGVKLVRLLEQSALVCLLLFDAASRSGTPETV